MSWMRSSSTQPRSMRSASLTTSERIASLHASATSSHTSSSSIHSSTESIHSSTSEQSSTKAQPFSTQKLYLLLPNHKCPNKKTCPFHPPEEQEEELEEEEVTLVNKRRAMSLASHEDQMITETLLAEKLAKINQQISSNLLEGNKLHLPRKTSHDITLPTADLEHLRFDHYNSETYPAPSSTREESVTSDYDLDSGVTFDSCSDRELDDDSLPLIQEEIVIPDITMPNFELQKAEEIKEMDEQQTIFTEADVAVEINEVSTVDSETYSYQIASYTDTTESSASVYIEEPLSKQHSKPLFVKELEYLTVTEGSLVKLECSVTGDPNPNIQWYKNNTKIASGNPYKIDIYEDGTVILTIDRAQVEDSGSYTCVAENVAGSATTQSKIRVQSEKEIEIVDNDFLRPKFIKKIEDVQVREGEDATFTCTATGKPMPDFKWQRDTITITSSDFVEIESNTQGHAHLTMKKVKASDGGLYYCVVQSKAGRAKCSAYLHVKAKSASPVNIKEKKNDEYIKWQARKESSVERGTLGSAPSLALVLPDTLDVVVGGKLKLDCSVQGYPIPLVTWHKGDRGLMYSQRHRIVPCGTLHMMEIPQVMALDKGEYIVRATNIHGTVQSSCSVNILPKGSKTAPPNYNKEAMIVVTKQNLQAPYFVKNLPNSIDAVLGMNVRLDCIMRDGIELIKWSKSQSPPKNLQKDVKDLADEGFHGELIPLEAKSHKSEDKKESDTVVIRSSGKEENKLEHVNFITTPKNLVLPAGSEAVFECFTAGSTEPEVKWCKDGKQLTVSNRVTVTTAGSKHTLKITDICSSDEGEYTCMLDATNGTKTLRVALTVTDVQESRSAKIQPAVPEQKPTINIEAQDQFDRQEKKEQSENYGKPSFIQLLPKSATANHGDNVELTCQLTSADVAGVKWELDSRELRKDDHYHISSDISSNQHKLLIHNVTEADSAKYTCVVYFKNGDIIYTSTKLDVSAAKPECTQKEEAPHFTTKLKDTVVKDGEGLILECDIEGNPRPQILWLRDNLEIFDSPDFQISTIGCHCKLQINDIYPEDEGNYSCRAVNNLGEALSTSYVTVEDLSRRMSADSTTSTSSRNYEKNRSRRGETREGDRKKKTKKEHDKPESPPELVVKPRRQFIDDGSNAKFKASFDGSKSTILFWSKDGQVLKEDEHFKMYEADGFHFLEVQKVSVEDGGMYSVTAQNLAGSDTAEAELEVFEKPKLLTRSGPAWEQTLQDLTVEEEATDVQLVCTCKELIQPTVRWFHNGKEVFSGFHIKLSHVAQTATLTIKEIKEQDIGEFKCIMTGKNGELETSCNLTVGNPEIMDPPVFVKELHDMEVEEGDKLQLDVEVKDNSHISWYHNNVEILHANPHYLIASVGHVHTLTLLLATSEFSGEYVCEAYNNSGSTETYSFIEVKEVNHPEPPSFVVHPLNLSTCEGDTATFTVQVKGQPTPSVHWKKGDVTISTNQKFKMTRINDIHTMTVNNTDYSDGGEYVCYLHNTEGSTSHACILHVATNQKYSWQPQTVDLQKSRSDHKDRQQSEYESAESGEQPLIFQPAISKVFTRRGLLHLGTESENSGVLIAQAEQKTFETTIGTTTATVQPNVMSQHRDGVNRQHNLHQYQIDRLNHNPELDHSKSVKAGVNVANNSGFQSNVSNPTSDYQFNPRISQKVEEPRSIPNCRVTDYRSVLKQRQRSSSALPEKSNAQTLDMDFRTAQSQNKTKEFKDNKTTHETVKVVLINSELNNLCAAQTSTVSLTHTGQLNSASDRSSSSLSDPLYSTTHEEGGQILKDFTYLRKEATVNDRKPISIIQDASGNADISSFIGEPSQMIRESWKSRSDHPSLSSRNLEQKYSAQDFNMITSGRAGQENVISERIEPFSNLTENNSLSVTRSMSNTFSTKTDSDGTGMEHKPHKVILSQLSARKVSIIEFNPFAPQSEASKLEMTSVSASSPQRQSLSSPQLHPQSHSMIIPLQSTAYNTDKSEDKDAVFIDISKDRGSSYLGPKHTSRSIDIKHNLQSVESVFIQEKTPVDLTAVKMIQSSDQSNDTLTNDNTVSQMRRSRTRFSEYLPFYKDQEHQEREQFSAASRNRTSSYSNTSSFAPRMSAVSTDNLVDDFRSVKLKPASPKIKEKSDLSKSKFMSKSTESIFTDIKLKPVAQTNDSYKKSDISSNAERIKASSRSSDLSKLLSTSTYRNSSINNPTSRTTIIAPSTAPKFSDCLKTFNSNAKPKGFLQTSKYPKSAQSSKLRSSAEKYEKASPSGVRRTNSHKKSKGIGAKFEAAIKDIKSNTQQVPYTSLHLAGGTLTDVKTSRQQNSSGNNSVGFSNNWNPARASSSENILKKTGSAVSQSTSKNTSLDSGNESYRNKISDWVKKRQSLQIDNSLTSNKSIFSDKGRLSDVARVRQEDKQNLETNSLYQTRKSSILLPAKDKQDVKVDWLNKQFSEDIVAKIRDRSQRDITQGTHGHELMSFRLSDVHMKTGPRQDNAGVSKYELNTDDKITHNDLEVVTSKVTSVNTDRKSVQVSNNNEDKLYEIFPKQSGLLVNESFGYASKKEPDQTSVTLNVSRGEVRKSEMYKTEFVIIPKNEAQLISSTVILTKPVTELTTVTILPSAGTATILPSAGTATILPSAVTATILPSAGTAHSNIESVVLPEGSFTSISPSTEIVLSKTSWLKSEATEQLKGSESENVSLTSDVASIDLKGSSEIRTDEATNQSKSPPRQGSEQFLSENEQSHLKNASSSWMKQKSQRYIAVYPVNDTEMSPYTEPLRICMDDSESVLSIPSISPSSSDASNVTVDSGYTRNHFRRIVGKEKMDLVSEILSPKNPESWKSATSSRELNSDAKNQISDFSDVKNNFIESSKFNQNTDGQGRQSDHDEFAEKDVYLASEVKYISNRSRRLREEHSDETYALASSDKESQKQKDNDVNNAKTYNDKIEPMDLKLITKDPNESQILEFALKDTDPNVTESGFENLTNDFCFPFYTRRQRRQFERNNVTSTDFNLKTVTGETVTDVSKYDSLEVIGNPVTFNETSRQKHISLPYKNPPAAAAFENINSSSISSVSDVKSDWKRNELTLNTEFGKREPTSGNEYRKDTDDPKDIIEFGPEPGEAIDELKFKEGTVAHYSSEQNPDTRIRSNVLDKANEGHITAGQVVSSQDEIPVSNFSDNDTSQKWRPSRLENPTLEIHHGNAKLDKKPSAQIHQDDVRTSKLIGDLTAPYFPASSNLLSATIPTITSSAVMSTISTLPKFVETEHQQYPPSFPVPLHDSSSMYGSKLVLQCQVNGNPRPDVKWLLNQKQIETNDKIEIIYSDTTAQLTIIEASSEHAGDYTCWARNSLGTVSSHCTLNLEDDQTNKVTDSKASCITAVSETHAHEMNIHLTNNVGIDKAANNNYRDSVPDAPSGRPLVSAKEKDSAYLSWCEPEHCKESDVTHYIIEAKIGEEKTWDVVVLNCQELSCHIQGLKPSTAYQFRILAANTHGVSSPSEPSETFNTPEPLILTSDYKHENELHLATRLVTVNTSDKFEDLYDVEKEVGKGKFGVVYKCKHKSDGTVWAAKVVRCRAKEKIALKREIDIMNRLRHPKILLLWDAFESPRQMVLVMEFVGAGELFERVVADDFVLTENDCIHFMQQICEGVNYMHLKNILHLDLKPENILCIAEDSNRIKIIDFGLAQFHKDGQSTKVLFGTPEFIAPEVINYDEIGFVTDMWSVGVICYVLLSGLSPFLGDSDSETLSNVTSGEYDFDDEVFEEISNLAKDFISSLLVKKKEKRLLTKQCLEHPWLSQDDIDGAPRKRLSTERLKKFMIRRKWLKTGNAVKAVSRLLKSNSLSGFGIFNHSIGNDNMLDTPSPSIQTQDSILQMTTEAVLDEVDQDEPNFNEDCILPDISTNVGNFSQDITEESFSSSVSNQTYSSKVESPTKSIWTSTEDKEIVTHSSEKITDSAAGVISKEEMASSNRDEAASNSASRFISSKSTDLNSTSKTASALSSSPIPTSSRLSNDVLSSSTSENKVSPHVNKTVNDVNQVPRVSDEKALHQVPYFTKTMIKCKTCTGDVARFEVTVSGNPLPHVTWFFEDEEIQSDSRHILRSNKNATTFSLTIRNIEEDDDGEYTCKAINSQGESTCAAYLSVLQV